jgi:plasmid stabilization system protein ParE
MDSQKIEIGWMPGAAKVFEQIPIELAEKILKKIELLFDFPGIGAPMFDDWEGYRQLVSEPYRIIYRIITEEYIEICYIRYTKQRL